MEIVDALLVATGCPEDVAKGAIDSARYYFKGIRIDQDIADCILNWHDYAQSTAGLGIKDLGKFIASRVRKLRQPPIRVQEDRLLREFVRLLLKDQIQDPLPQSQSEPVVQRHG